MKKFSGILICSDFDGTIAVGGKISEENSEAVRYFCSRGGSFALITGRTFGFLRPHCEQLSLDGYVGCINGTQICEIGTGKAVYDDILTGDLDLRLERIVDKYWESMSGSAVFYGNDAEGMDICSREDAHRLPRACGDRAANKAMIYTKERAPEEMIADVAQMLGDKYLLTRSGPRLMEIQNAHWSKGRAAKKIQELVGAKFLVCAGDYENDIAMIEVADMGVATANGSDALKSMAVVIAPDARDHAIAWLIKYIEQNGVAQKDKKTLS